MSKTQLEPIVALLRERARNIPRSIEEMREDFDAFTQPFAAVAGLVREPVQAGAMAAEWLYFPEQPEKPVVYYLHGGGYVIGSIATHAGIIGRLARASGARAFAVNYRLGPEHPFPAAVEDAVAGYLWLLSHGVDHKQVVMAGDSAGGGLVISALAAARDRGLPAPAGALCFSPWTDLACTGPSMSSKAASDPVIQKAGALLFADLYLNGAPATAPLASPLYADVRGLPPVLIQVGEREVLLDDAVRMAARLREAGVDARLDVWEDMVHVWHFFAGQLDEGQEALAAAGRFVQERTRANRRT